MEDHYFKDEQEFPCDILAIAHNGFVDFFRLIIRVFVEIKEIKLNQRAMNYKIEKDDDNQNRDNVKASDL